MELRTANEATLGPMQQTPKQTLLAVLVLLGLCTACAGPDVRTELSQAGFRTPRQTFDTYRAAFLSDFVTLEYLCLSDHFKAANGITILNYGEVREIMLDDQAFLRFGLGRAKIVRVEPLTANRVRLHIRSESLFHDVQFACELVREDFYEIWADGERLQDDHLERFSNAFRITPAADGTPVAQSWVTLEDPDSGIRISEFRVGREWKIDFINLLDPAQLSDSHGTESLKERQTP